MVLFSEGIMAFASIPYYRNVVFVPETHDVRFSRTVNPLMTTLHTTSRHPRESYPFPDYFKGRYNHLHPAASMNFPPMPRWLLNPEITYTSSYSKTRRHQKYRSTDDKIAKHKPKTELQINNTSGGNPSITPVPPEMFAPLQDAKALFRALRGSKINATKIIQILTKRSNEQRIQIATKYKHFYDMDLEYVIKNKTKGKFRDLLLALLTPLPQLYATELNLAMKRMGMDEDVLIEILCTLTNDEIQVVKQMYYQSFNKHLEEDIKEETAGNFQKLLLTLCAVNRSEDYSVNTKKAILQAKKLIAAGEMRMETEEQAFISILCSQSFPQLLEVFSQYNTMTGQNIEEAIKNEFVGLIKKALKVIVKVVRSKPHFFAERLYKSMSGLGTNNRQIIRIMVTRSENDLGDIEDVFFQQYHYSLENWIEEDCHGNYGKCLLSILGAA